LTADPQEVNAITEVFTNGRNKDHPLLMGATKSNMGHAEPAAALCAVTKVALSLQKGIIPSNLHFKNPNPNIPAIMDGRIQVRLY
jgi:fatty acid synthase